MAWEVPANVTFGSNAPPELPPTHLRAGGDLRCSFVYWLRMKNTRRSSNRKQRWEMILTFDCGWGWGFCNPHMLLLRALWSCAYDQFKRQKPSVIPRPGKAHVLMHCALVG